MDQLPQTPLIDVYFMVIPAKSRQGGVYSDALSSFDDRIQFQIIPSVVSETKSAKFTDIDILGRAEPIRTYAGSSATHIELDIDYYWYSSNPNHIGHWDKIKHNVNKLRALTYPSVKDEFCPPPKVLFYFGDLYKGLPCLVLSVQINYNTDTTDQWVREYGDQFRSPDFHPSHSRVHIALETSYALNAVPGYEDITSNIHRLSYNKYVKRGQ